MIETETLHPHPLPHAQMALKTKRSDISADSLEVWDLSIVEGLIPAVGVTKETSTVRG